MNKDLILRLNCHSKTSILEIIMPRLILSIVFILLIFGQSTFAQETNADSVEGWEIVERCVGEPITPPDDWTFDGTILATGWAGIHGINADWDVTRILAFRSNWTRFAGADISPNRRWIVVVLGYDNPISNVFDYSVSAYALQIYDVTDRSNQIQIPIKLDYDVFGSTGNGASYHTVAPRWLDNEHFIYRIDDEVVSINPFTQEISDWDVAWNIEDVDPLAPSSIAFPSPDWTRLIYDLEIGLRYELFDILSGDSLTVVAEQPDFRSEFLPVWRADSSGFIMDDENALRIFDREGQQLDTIASSNFVHFFQSWSPDERYLVLADISNHSLQIADFEERLIYDTCISIDGWSRMAWNLDSTQFAFYLDRTSDTVSIFDVERWSAYSTNIEHAGTLFSWYQDPD